MSTANPHQSPDLQKLSWFLEHRVHDVWDRFSPAEQEQMVNEDLFAGTSVSILLGSLITVGMLLSIITLATVILTS